FATGEATPRKAWKFKKIASPTKKQILVLEEEPAKKSKHAKHPKPAKKSAPAKKDDSSSRKQSTGVQIRDTPDVSVSKKKAPATTDRSKGIDLLSETTGINEGTGTIPEVPDVPKDQSESNNKSWGESRDDDDSNDDNSDDV
ncbi:hypothetical protein Tco_1249004, partial [Tanacetum coccineum]